MNDTNLTQSTIPIVEKSENFLPRIGFGITRW